MGFPKQTTYLQKILITKPELNGKTLAQLKSGITSSKHYPCKPFEL